MDGKEEMVQMDNHEKGDGDDVLVVIAPEKEPPPTYNNARMEKKQPPTELKRMEPAPIPQEPEEDDEEEDSDWENVEDADEEEGADKNVFLIGKVISAVVERFQKIVMMVLGLLSQLTRGYLVTIVVLTLFFVYFIIALCYRSHDEGAKRLIGVTVFGILIYTRSYIKQGIRWLFQKVAGSEKLTPKMEATLARIKLVVRWSMYVVLAVACVVIIVDEGKDEVKNLESIPGLFCMVLVCLFLSKKPSKINWHTIYWSLGLQFLMAFFALRWKFGKDSVFYLQARLDEFFDHAKQGSLLLFGESYEEHYLIFGALPVFIFTNGAITILYYLGAMQFLVKSTGSFLGYILGTSPIESMSVAAGIFLESVTALSALIPYMPGVTRSQLFLIMTSTFASIGGAYLAMLSRLQVPLEHLIASMVISAPATFCVCKLIMPETQKMAVADDIDVGEVEKKKYGNVLDAASAGATIMLGMLGNVVANIFCMWSFISWINATTTWFGDRVGIDELTIEEIASYLLYPISLAMGVESGDRRNVAMLLGYRVSSSSFLAYIKMTQMKMNRYKYMEYMAQTNFTGPIYEDNNDVTLVLWNETLKDGFISMRSEAIATYSLSGFSSFISAAICLGVLCIIVPKRKSWMAKNTMLALVAGNMANCMTGCFASLFY